MRFKKPTKSNLLSAGLLALFFSVGAGGAAGLSYYKSTVGVERINFKLALPEGEVKPINVDMSAHGLPKRLLQPDSIRLRARSIDNKGDEALPLMVAFEGIPGTLAVKSGGETFDPETQLHVVDAGSRWRFDIYIHLPPEFRNEGTAISGQMTVKHAINQTTLATVPINIAWGDE